MGEKIKLGIIGCGAIAKQYHMPALKALEGCAVVAVCDLIRERAQYAAGYFGIPDDRVFTDADELLQIDEIEGVIILTPNYNHCPMTEMVASRKKHVFVTKPMARNSEECRRMIAACESNGVQLFVSFMHRYLSGIEEARRLIAEKYIGNINLVRILNAPGATSTVSKWFYKKENVGGGAVMDIGVHGIDIVRYLLGGVDRVLYANVGRFKDTVVSNGETIYPDNEDHAAAVYQLKSGAIVNQVISWHHWSTADRFSMEIFGDEGSIFLRGTMGMLTVAKVRPGEPVSWVSKELPFVPMGEKQHQDFIDMIRTGGKAYPDGAEGLACIRVAEAIYQSAEQGCEVGVI